MKIDANGVRTDDIPDRAPLQYVTIYARRLDAAGSQVITETSVKLVEGRRAPPDRSVGPNPRPTKHIGVANVVPFRH